MLKRKFGHDGDEIVSSARNARPRYEADQGHHSGIPKKSLGFEEYTVGWICPLEVEQVAAIEMLDEEHERLNLQHPDDNVYTLGSIAGHNIVIAGLPRPGNNSAAKVIAQMKMTFRNVAFAILVGIGGGVPVKSDNGMIRLGHVVVSKPAGKHSGAVQYDRGKAEAGKFKRTGALDSPPAVLLNAAQDLAAKRARSRTDPIAENIRRIDNSRPRLQRYKHPGPAQDHVYEPGYVHEQPGVLCADCGCDPARRVMRDTSVEDDDEPYVIVHRGTIASGEMVIKDGIKRDQLAKKHGVLCFETEAAGAISDCRCIIIRGISDYCDSHKNDQWHGYAAAAAAAYARQLFFHIPIEVHNSERLEGGSQKPNRSGMDQIDRLEESNDESDEVSDEVSSELSDEESSEGSSDEISDDSSEESSGESSEEEAGSHEWEIKNDSEDDGWF